MPRRDGELKFAAVRYSARDKEECVRSPDARCLRGCERVLEPEYLQLAVDRGVRSGIAPEQTELACFKRTNSGRLHLLDFLAEAAQGDGGS